MATAPHQDRRTFLKLSLAASTSIVLSPLLKACNSLETAVPAPTGSPSPFSTPQDVLAGLRGVGLDAFFQQAYRRWAARDPETLTTLGLADAYGVGDGMLTDISDEFIHQTQELETALLSLLRQYDRAAFSASQSVTADVLDWFLDDLVRGHAYLYDDYPVSPIITSIPFSLYALFTIYHPLETLQDAEDYIARLSQVDFKLASLIDGLKRRADRGVVLPGFMLRYVVPDIEALAAGTPPYHAYFTSFTTRLRGASEEQRRTLSARVQERIQAHVIPAYGDLAAFLRDQEGHAPDNVGVWQFSDGTEYYSQSLRRHTTTDLSPDEIHKLGLENVERVQAEIRERFVNLGYAADEPMPRLFERLSAQSGVYKGQEAVPAYESTLEIARMLVPLAFDAIPRAQVRVVGGNEGDYYMPASADGSRPGLFFARTDGELARFGVKTTGFHEMVPGHHFQIALAQEIPGLPDLRRAMQFNAYTEGWALYAERLMWELGAYKGDPQSDLGRLRMEAFRAARLVVDTAIHAMRWSFDRAVDYLVQATGHTVGFARSEVTRYSVWPGQATSYYVGFLRLLGLRDRARAALDDAFDLKAFHRVVLSNGSVPVSILERLIDQYVAAAPKSGTVTPKP